MSTEKVEKKLILQKILLPQIEICNEKELYCRSNNILFENNELLIYKESQCLFNTYFNAFSIGKWKKYTKINNLYLKLFGEGSILLEVVGSCWINEKVINETISSQRVELSENSKIEIKCNENYSNIYFKISTFGKRANLKSKKNKKKPT